MLLLFAFLGIPIWFLAGILIVLLLRRRAIKATPGAFACHMRHGSAGADLEAKKWKSGVARWERDVLVLARTLTPAGFEAYAADELPAKDVWFLKQGKIRGIGEGGVVLPIRLASGQIMELAVPPSLVPTAAGPFPVPTASTVTNGRAPIVA